MYKKIDEDTCTCQWRGLFIPVPGEGLWEMPPQGGGRIHTSAHECQLFFFLMLHVDVCLQHQINIICCNLRYIYTSLSVKSYFVSTPLYFEH